ncbi:hypothetical protein BASA50_005213 [Batrachochytrium salamandrivorans]|uniref:Uncharacterized protein n=1 Tax=Batrachochytrium salamandrivorans TaxID=1357716 RepID=A0ABQ8FD14_9FUNG|nr:hypothetical protein BASA62_004589 [Batrachochytrium salamandrivorans]KAH6593925.1 hypothetical protein BASA61_004144 [Batrachochytrium salamandrivorans]KAH6596173.1 hypothetical protein BASA50_005213 [Batrachochytrium salamandrivorans]KAH9272034.1 hypothetical protein BASA83_005621 [Batrachochytrium salamandrivorans]
MQFFHLFSFVVVASYAAALPQPAELSKKYSSNVDANLASGLEARSYQPGLNSQKNSATLVSLKRRDDSEGSSGENSESDSFLPSTSGPNEPFKSPFSDSDVDSINLASTIDKVGDGIANIYENGEKAGQKIGGNVGEMLARYIRRDAYVISALRHCVHISVPGILEKIKSGLGDDEYSKVEPDLTEKLKQLENEVRAGLDEILDATTKILGSVGPVTENIQKIDKSFKLTISGRMEFFGELRILLGWFEDGKTLENQLADVSKSVDKFSTDQQPIYVEIMEELGAAPSE